MRVSLLVVLLLVVTVNAQPIFGNFFKEAGKKLQNWWFPSSDIEKKEKELKDEVLVPLRQIIEKLNPSKKQKEANLIHRLCKKLLEILQGLNAKQREDTDKIEKQFVQEVGELLKSSEETNQIKVLDLLREAIRMQKAMTDDKFLEQFKAFMTEIEDIGTSTSSEPTTTEILKTSTNPVTISNNNNIPLFELKQKIADLHQKLFKTMLGPIYNTSLYILSSAILSPSGKRKTLGIQLNPNGTGKHILTENLDPCLCKTVV